MRKLTASATLCVGLTLLATQAEAQHKTHSGVVHTQAEAQHKTHSGVVHTQREYVRLAEVCAFGFWCDTGILDSNNPATPPPLVTPKAKLAHGIDRSQFRPEIASYPELVVKMTHMVFGEVGRYAPLPVKIIQLETAFNRAQARAQTLAHVLLSVKEAPTTAITPSKPILRPQSRHRRKSRRSRRPSSLRYSTARTCPTLVMVR